MNVVHEMHKLSNSHKAQLSETWLLHFESWRIYERKSRLWIFCIIKNFHPTSSETLPQLRYVKIEGKQDLDSET